MSDFSVIVISLAVIVLCWAVVRINQKIDEMSGNTTLFNDLEGVERKPAPTESSRP